MTENTRNKKVLPWLMACALFMETLDVTIISTAIPSIARDLHCEPVLLKFALTAYLLSLAVFIPISGWAADKFGSRKVFTGALGLFTMGSVACGAASTLFWLVMARLLQGAGGSMMLPVARLVLLRAFSKKELVAVTNYATIPSLIGPTLGPLIGGLIVTCTTWRWIFLVNVPFGLIGMLLAQRYVHDLTYPQVRKLDFVGFGLFGLSLAALSFGFESIGEEFLSPTVQTLLLTLALFGLVCYTWHANRLSEPFLNLALLRIRTFRVTVLGSLLCRLGIGGVSFLLPLMLQVGFGWSPLRAGALLVPISVAMIVMKFFVKTILSFFGFRKTLMWNTFALGVCVGSFALCDAKVAPTILISLSFAYGLMASLQFSCMNVLTFVDVGNREMSDATSIAAVVQQFSMSFGVAVAALCLSICLKQPGWTPFVPHAYQTTFVCVGFVTAMSAVVFSWLSASDGTAAAPLRSKKGG